jgi:tetratricopeptide (TPR) repeat protein
MSGRQVSWSKCIEAEFLVLDGELSAAAAVYDEVVGKEPRNARALCGKGALAGEGQKWQEARRYFEEALSYQPSYDVALAGLGLCEMVGNNMESAFELFQKAAKANPENQRALFGVLQVGYPLKRYGEIEEMLTNYLDLHPANVDMLYSFAGVLFAQGKLQQARMEVEKILLFEPSNPRALELRNVIDTGKSAGSTVSPT